MISGTVRPSAFARFDIDDEFELGRRLHRKVCGFLALENAIDIEGRLAELVV